MFEWCIVKDMGRGSLTNSLLDVWSYVTCEELCNTVVVSNDKARNVQIHHFALDSFVFK